MSARYLDFNALSAKLAGRSRSSIMRDVKAGRLPRPLETGQGIHWPEAAVDDHLAKMMGEQFPESLS